MEKNIAITAWALEDRPREKMMAKGVSSLTNAELIAILIGSGNRDESAVELSKRILNDAENNLNELGRYSLNKLMDFKGIGEAKAISIIAALELGKRRKIADVLQRKIISSTNDAAEYFQNLIGDLPHEEFWALYLNQKNFIISSSKIGLGGVANVSVDIKILIKQAIENLASGIIVCHNHPSGSVTPSKEDSELTVKINNACGFMDIVFHDHIIVSQAKYFSFADNNLI